MRKASRAAIAAVVVAVTVPALAVLAVAGTSEAAATGGVTAGSVSTSRAAPAGSAVRVAAASSGHEKFKLTTRSATSRRENAQATGVLNAHGYAIVGKNSAGGSVTARLFFPHGSVRITTTVTRSSVSVPNPKTCRFTEEYHGKYTLHGVSRTYASASGSGVDVLTIIGHLNHQGSGCGATVVSFWQSLKTWGTMRW